MDLLKSHKKKQAQFKLRNRLRVSDYHGENFVFCRKNGYPFVTYAIFNQMKKTTAFKMKNTFGAILEMTKEQEM
ncbi:hypothetical protein [Domibacillus aminovorans]|uniref:Uncharacterized protein n=1 Tax=Domibacillus aminovorans TaxID=29332 RepID=A0A177LC55_9BACI|nr:hypothetical protein [Domibacillus aminovorans]OAH63124.1 hypothetical protein AWH49_07225 [Domibacillus aminovorans]